MNFNIETIYFVNGEYLISIVFSPNQQLIRMCPMHTQDASLCIFIVLIQLLMIYCKHISQCKQKKTGNVAKSILQIITSQRELFGNNVNKLGFHCETSKERDG